MQDLIQRYAELEASQVIAQRTGMKFPLEMAQEMGRIEALAKSRFTPDQLAQAMQHVEHAKTEAFARYGAIAKSQREAEFKKGMDKLARSLTKGVVGQTNGLSADQFKELRDEGRVTLPSKRIGKHDADTIIRVHTARFDKSGEGYTKAEWTKRLDAMTDALVVKGNEEAFQELASQYNAEPDVLRKAAKDWAHGRIAVGMDERRNAKVSTEPEVLEPNDHERRRTQIADAWLTSLPEDVKTPREAKQVESEFASMRGDLSKEYTEDKGLRGDVARAFERAEREEDAA